jgi:hypothetical protein
MSGVSNEDLDEMFAHFSWLWCLRVYFQLHVCMCEYVRE